MPERRPPRTEVSTCTFASIHVMAPASATICSPESRVTSRRL